MFVNIAARITRKTVEILLLTFLCKFTAEEGVQNAYLSDFIFTDNYCMIYNNYFGLPISEPFCILANKQ